MARLAQIDLRVDGPIAILAFALSLGLLAAGDGAHDTQVDALTVVLTALSSLPLVVRRRAPLAVFAFTAVASAALRLLAAPAGGPVGPTIALYGVAAAGDVTRRTLAVVAGVFALHLGAVGIEQGAFPLTEIGFGLLVWGAAWLAGERTRLRAARLAELEDRARRAEREAERERRLVAAEERMRIARDLHDSAGHAINVILVHAGLGRLRLDSDPAGTRAALETIEEVARDTVGEIDQLVRALRAEEPHDVEPPAGVAALDGLVAHHRAAGLDVDVEVEGERRPLSPGVDQGVYRIVQEALTNAARHGDGDARVRIVFADGSVDVTVANPVRPDDVLGGDGHGLVGMRERAALLGGSLEAGRRNGDFEVRARLPLAGRAR